jgi:hypothetical protein
MTVWVKLGVALAALAILAALPSDLFAADATHSTVVELFQDQGCSSCPPAAANVAAAGGRPVQRDRISLWAATGGTSAAPSPWGRAPGVRNHRHPL